MQPASRPKNEPYETRPRVYEWVPDEPLDEVKAAITNLVEVTCKELNVDPMDARVSDLLTKELNESCIRNASTPETAVRLSESIVRGKLKIISGNDRVRSIRVARSAHWLANHSGSGVEKISPEGL